MPEAVEVQTSGGAAPAPSDALTYADTHPGLDTPEAHPYLVAHDLPAGLDQ